MVMWRMHKRYRMSENDERFVYLTSFAFNTVARKTTIHNQSPHAPQSRLPGHASGARHRGDGDGPNGNSPNGGSLVH